MRPLRDINIKVAITVNIYHIFTSELCIEGTGNNFRGRKSPVLLHWLRKKSRATKLASKNAGKECNCIQQKLFTPFSGGPAVYGEGLRPLTCWDCGFESRRRHESLSLLSFRRHRVEDSATGRSLIQESYQVCVSLSVITCNYNPLHQGFLTFLKHRPL